MIAKTICRRRRNAKIGADRRNLLNERTFSAFVPFLRDRATASIDARDRPLDLTGVMVRNRQEPILEGFTRKRDEPGDASISRYLSALRSAIVAHRTHPARPDALRSQEAASLCGLLACIRYSRR
jgi:hypothetical protein